MKNIFICFIAVCITLSEAQAQFVTKSNVFIKSGTPVSIDGLVMIPSTDFNIQNNGLQTSMQPLSGSPVKSISRVYNFTNAVSFSGSIGTYYIASELNGIAEANLQVGYSPATNTAIAGDAASVRDVTNHYVSTGVTNKNIQVFSLVDGQEALPVSLINFTATLTDNGVNLSWETAEERNAGRFGVERSADGKSWEEIGSRNAAGNSKSRNAYFLQDENPLIGTSYYRLKMIDLDGTFAYSQVRNVKWDRAEAFSVFPNPFTDHLNIHPALLGKVKPAGIVNAAGQDMKYHRKIGTDGKLDLSGISPGIYIIKLTLQDGSVRSFKVIKN